MKALLPIFAAHPQVLFVYLTPPPLAPGPWRDRAFKWLANKALGKPTTDEQFAHSGAVAREVNDWAASPDGWLAGYGQRNVVSEARAEQAQG